MNNKLLKSNKTGLFLVLGSGFTGTQANASRIPQAEAVEVQSCAKAMGLGDTTLVDAPNVSYAPVYIRGTDIVTATGVQKGAAKGNLGQVDPSKRRFATRAEANTHGKRFDVRKAKQGDLPGSAGHVGFYVIETNDPVNAAVNPATGLTNPI